MPEVSVFISIGSNIEPQTYIRNSIQALQDAYAQVALSPIYESLAVGFVGDNFYNLVARVETTQPAEAVYQQLRHIEDSNQRQRGAQKFSARTLDLDLLLYGEQCLNTPNFTLPRDEILKYAFVLRPLADLYPQGIHPEVGESYADLWTNFQSSTDFDAQSMWQVELG